MCHRMILFLALQVPIIDEPNPSCTRAIADPKWEYMFRYKKKIVVGIFSKAKLSIPRKKERNFEEETAKWSCKRTVYVTNRINIAAHDCIG